MIDDEEELIIDEERQKDKRSKIRYVKKKARLLLEESGSKIPVLLNDVVHFLKEDRNISITCKALELKEKFSGQIIICGDAVGIIYNKNHSRNRQRFTVAHEIGHLVLEHEFKVSEYKEIINFQTKSPMEREANLFAAELLMSKENLISYLENNKTNSVKDLALVFGVSEDAMWFKISEDNLLKYF